MVLKKSRRFLHRGVKSFFDDILDARIDVKCVFDVGAHKGESVRLFSKYFPRSSIYSFEPVPENCNDIKETFSTKIASGELDLHLFPFALSDSSQDASFVLWGSGAHVLKTGENVDKKELTKVSCVTLDSICLSNHVDFIDILKIDVEGHEMEVLRGASNMMENHNIRIIYLELGMNRNNLHHTPFWDAAQFLESKGYGIFGFYEQINEFLLDRLWLRRANVAFIDLTFCEW